MSRQEILSWSSLAVYIVVGVWYFTATGFAPPRPLAPAGLLFGLVLAGVIVGVVAEIVLRAVSHSADQVAHDERDASIQRRAFRNAYAVLAAAVFYLIARIAGPGLPAPDVAAGVGAGAGIGAGVAAAARASAAAPVLVQHYWLDPLAPQAIAQLLLLGLVLAACALHLTRVVSYRRGG